MVNPAEDGLGFEKVRKYGVTWWALGTVRPSKAKEFERQLRKSTRIAECLNDIGIEEVRVEKDLLVYDKDSLEHWINILVDYIDGEDWYDSCDFIKIFLTKEG